MPALFLLAQENPLMGVPAPTESSSWWPFAMALLSLLIAGLSAAFAAWVKLSEKKQDHQAANDAATAKARADRAIAQLEDQNRFRDSLQSSLDSSLAEGVRLRDELKEALKVIAERNELVAELRGKLSESVAMVETLRSRVSSLEQSLVRSPEFDASDSMRQRAEEP